jgi:hypothetical protein
VDAATRTSLAERFRWQGPHCERLGSPLYGELCRRLADEVEADGPVLEVLAGHEHDSYESMLQLRLLGAVHRLALTGVAPVLAAHYPSTGGDGEVESLWDAFRETVAEQQQRLGELIERPVQTNEVGRSRALALGFAEVARTTGLPLRLLELGSSGGLNLRWDSFRYESGAFAFGDPDSPVRFADYHEGAELPAAPPTVEVVERAGCDRRPVDVTGAEGRDTLLAYTWADQLERFRDLEGALEVAQRVPATVERSPALPWLERRLAEPTPGACTVVFHSIVMQYVDPDERAAIDALVEQAGARATADAPLARLSFEPGDEYAHLRLSIWPHGGTTLLAECGYHGLPVRWQERTVSPSPL